MTLLPQPEKLDTKFDYSQADREAPLCRACDEQHAPGANMYCVQCQAEVCEKQIAIMGDGITRAHFPKGSSFCGYVFTKRL